MVQRARLSNRKKLEMPEVSFRAVLLLLAALAGCGVEKIDDNHGYGWQYDAQGASGWLLRYTPSVVAGDPLSDVHQYDAAFAAVETCTGISAPAPPFVIVLSQGSLGTDSGGGVVLGRYFRNPVLIVTAQTDQVVIDPSIPLIPFRHETIHYLLDYSTGDWDIDHRSTLFSLCTTAH